MIASSKVHTVLRIVLHLLAQVDLCFVNSFSYLARLFLDAQWAGAACACFACFAAKRNAK